MSENNYTNTEVEDTNVNYEDVNYKEGKIKANNIVRDSRPGMYYDEREVRNFQPRNRMPGARFRNYGPGENYQYNLENGKDLNNPIYHRNYNRMSKNYYRGDSMMRYPSNYRMENDYRDLCCDPYYYDDCDCDCDYDYDYDCYEPRRPYYKGYRPYRRRYMGSCSPYYNDGMMPNSWWNQRMITNIINRPRVNNFFRGVGIATVGLILAPSVARSLKPIIVKAVQGAMTTSEEFKGIFADAREDIEDIFAEAKWEGSNIEKCYNNGKDENNNGQ